MEKLGIDSKLLLAQVINFGLFFFIFKKFIAKPFRRFIEREKDAEEDREKVMKDVEKQKAEMIAKMDKFKADMKKESAAHLAEAKASAEKVKEDIIREAEGDATEIREKAKKQLELERTNMERAVRDKIVELSFFIVKNSLKDALSEETKKKVTAAILKNLPKKVSLYEN